MLRERRRHANYKPNRKLDRKSSRGMIYENEELRLRTININAEVERGQSDIRKLRRENDLLRREVWTLRDEYDRLDKILHSNQSGDNSNNNNCNKKKNKNDGNGSFSQSEKSDSDTNSDTDGHNTNDESNDDDDDDDDVDDDVDDETNDDSDDSDLENINNNNNNNNNNYNNLEIVENNENVQKTLDNNNKTRKNLTENIKLKKNHNKIVKKFKEKLHVNFDHLSIVSEENLTLINNNQNNYSDNNYSDNNNKTSVLSSSLINNGLGTSYNIFKNILTENYSPILNDINDLQSIVPPLKHFESLPYDTLGPSIDSFGELCTSDTTTSTGDTIINRNELDDGRTMLQNYGIGMSNVILTGNIGDEQQTLLTTIVPSTMTSMTMMTTTAAAAAQPPPSAAAAATTTTATTTATTTTPTPTPTTTKKEPKNFFSTISKEKRHYQPDVFVNNVLPCTLACTSTPYILPPYYPNYLQQQQQQSNVNTTSGNNLITNEPIYATISKPTKQFQTGGNLEDLLLDMETISTDILKMQVEKKNYLLNNNNNNLIKDQQQQQLQEEDDDNDNDDDDDEHYQQQHSQQQQHLDDFNLIKYDNELDLLNIEKLTTASTSTKPYRSEINLLLTYPDGKLPVITTINNNIDITPPIKIPEPMLLFPNNLQYTGYNHQQQYQQQQEQQQEQEQQQQEQQQQQPEQLNENLSVLQPCEENLINTEHVNQTNQNIIIDNPVTLKRRLFARRSSMKSDCIISGVNDKLLISALSKTTTTFGNKNKNFNEITNGEHVGITPKTNDKIKTNCSSIIGNIFDNKRKSKRVSIYFSGKKDKTDEKTKEKELNQIELLNDNECISGNTIITSSPLSSLPQLQSSSSLSTATQLQQTQSSSNINLTTTGGSPGLIIRRRHSVSNRKSSHDSGVNLDTGIIGQQSGKIKRGSLGSNSNSKITNNNKQKRSKSNDHTSGGGNTTNDHHHHNHHHHHSSSGSHEQNSTGGVTINERNSIVSTSRESSTSLSLKSQKSRKLSINSHAGGGKIPWCGCWGNGCL